MELYVARHGETEWNAKELLCGRTDLPLNESGKAQAAALAKVIAQEEKRPQVIIASPLTRAQQTAGILAQRLGIAVETDARLIEQNYGIYESNSIREPAFVVNRTQFAVKYPQGESMLQVAQRVYAFLDELKARPDIHSAILVSHGGTCRVLNTYFEDVTNEAFAAWRMQNAQCLRYTL